jgi:hypothetical protein
MKVHKFVVKFVCVVYVWKYFGLDVNDVWDEKFSNGNRYVHRFIIIFVKSSSIRERGIGRIQCVYVMVAVGWSKWEGERIEKRKSEEGLVLLLKTQSKSITNREINIKYEKIE